ncbi:hypothetical protein CDAR_558091 [Caerostris darwini]|uniref:Uncharacterized protein n=1 Tax=Caerostris darwini TaxID=1538125 RepID=A0AAV4R7Y8_9ARAC|nr:hypothetical protein CDAR_558091 [Caerostris darwini]
MQKKIPLQSCILLHRCTTIAEFSENHCRMEHEYGDGTFSYSVYEFEDKDVRITGRTPQSRRGEGREGGAVYRGSRAKGVGLCSRNLTGGRLSDGCAPPLRNRNSNPREGGHHSPIITYSLRLLHGDAIKGPALTTTNRLPQMTPPLAIHLADLSAQGTSAD